MKNKYLAAICLLFSILAFVIPFILPSQEPCVSMSYDVGFNNKLGIVCILFISLFVFIVGFLFGGSHHNVTIININHGSDDKISKKTFYSALFLTILFFLIYALACSNYILYAGEGSYFTMHVYDVLSGKNPYDDFVFYYGPYFIYFPVFIIRVLPFLSVELSYVLSLAVSQIVSLYLLRDVVNIFSLSKRNKEVYFIVVAIAIIPITMGFNCCLIRYVIAPWLLLKLIMLNRKGNNGLTIIGFLLFSTMVTIAISPEIGVVCSLISSFYFSFKYYIERNYSYIFYSIIPILVLLFTWLFFPLVFKVITDFSAGCNNFPFIPYIGFLLYIGYIYIACFQASLLIRDIRANYNVLFIILISLSTLPAALGRCDPGHLLFNGWLLCLVSSIVLISEYPKLKRIWICLSFIFLLYHLPGTIYPYSNTYYIQFLATLKECNLTIPSTIANSDRSHTAETLVENKTNLPFKFAPQDKVAMPFVRNSFFHVQLLEKCDYKELYFTKIWFSATEENISKNIEQLKDNKIEYLMLPKGWEDIQKPSLHHYTTLFLMPDLYSLKRNGNSVYQPLIEYINNNYILYQENNSWELYVNKKKNDRHFQ